MKVWMDRDKCDTNLAACLSCFGQFVRTGVPDRGCIMNFEDDDSEDIMVYMHSDGKDQKPIFIPEDMREIVAYDGWTEFVDFEPKFSKNESSDQIAAKKLAKQDVLEALPDRIERLLKRKKNTDD